MSSTPSARGLETSVEENILRLDTTPYLWDGALVFCLCLRTGMTNDLIGYQAGIAQLVEREPSKLEVAGSSPVSRSKI